MERISKENYYLDIAETVLERATCLRRIYGAIIVKNDEIISTGYNGAPPGPGQLRGHGLLLPGSHEGTPRRAVRAVPQCPRRGQRHHLCLPAGHGGRHHYLVGRNAATRELLNDATSCLMCRRMIINAGLDRVVIRRTETEFEVVPVEAWIAEDDLLTPENVVMDPK